MGSPVSGRVAHFCALDRNEGFFRSSILSCFAMGSPCGSRVFFSHSIVTKSALDIWSVFLQDGVTPVWFGSDDLISNEGITTVGLLGAFFRPVLGVSLCHPLVGRSALKRSGFHILLSSLLARTLCVPLANEGVGLGLLLLALLPLALPWGLVCFGSLAVILFTWAFHALVFHA